MLLIPLYPKDSQKFPLFSILLVIGNLLVFQITWTKQVEQASLVGQDNFQQSAQKLALVLLPSDSGISEEDRNILKTEYEQSPTFPSQAIVDIFKRTELNSTALSFKAKYQWDIAYPVFNSLLNSHPSVNAPSSMFKQWGFNPKETWWPNLITYQFLHEGWIHLISNMVFLWVSAVVAENILGFQLLWVYLAGGIAAAIVQAQVGIPYGQSIIGASGAVSALMGFCLIERPISKIKLFYFVFALITVRSGVFDCPLWFFLPLWLITQIFFASMNIRGQEMSVAYMAHIGGFIFGAMLGLLWRMFDTSPPDPTRPNS